MIKFGSLNIGDYFEYQGEVYVAVPLVKGGPCGCVPLYNSEGTYNSDLIALFPSDNKVSLIHRFRTNPHNELYVDSKERYLKRMIEVDDTLPIHTNTTYIIPLITDELVEYEETDTWLLYFNLGVEALVPYYEQFENGEWVSAC